MASTVILAKCENGHQQEFKITGGSGDDGLSDEGMKRYWDDFIKLSEYATNESPIGGQGCLECGAKVKFEVHKPQ